jgi:WD40 repeat protein/tRNA A-37 threonylcarbamoyl transferase component Bud32
MPVSDDRLEEALLAYLKEKEAGDAPVREEFLARYPELASELADYISEEHQVDTLFKPMRRVFVGESNPPLNSFGDYDVLGEIAPGGMGIVYRARQKSLNRIVALKVIKNPQLADATDRQRFHLEAELVANLNHPHIVPVYEVGEKDGRPYFSMKLIEGGSLAQHIAEWRLPEINRRTRKDSAGKTWSRAVLHARQDKIALLVETAALAVHYAHQRGLLHRDLKPGNILLDEVGQPYVTDFGLAIPLQQDGRADESQNVAGTASYMAPEQTLGKTELTVRADVYGLGAILYELLTGEAPFHGASWMDTLTQVREKEVTPPSSSRPYVARDLETICAKCLHKDPQARYGSAEALACDLNRFRAGRPIHARFTPKWERTWMWMKRKPLVATLYGTLALVVLLAVGTGIWQWRETMQALRDSENNLYAHRVILAERYLSNGSSDEAEKLLDLCRPEMRNWEWHYLKRWCRGDLNQLEGITRPIVAFAVHSNGKILITGDDQGVVHAWEGNHFHQPVVLDRHTIDVAKVHFACKSDVCAVAYKDKTVKVWEIQTIEKPRPPKVLFDSGELVAVSPDGKLVATSGLGRDVWVWDWANAKKVMGPFNHGDHVNCLAFSPDGGFLVSGGYGTKNLKVWDLSTQKERAGFELPSLPFVIIAIAFSPNGRWVALSDGTSLGLWNWEKSMADNETRLHGGYKGRFVSIAFSPDSQYVAATTHNGSVTVWEIKGKVVAFTAKRHTTMIPSVAFVPEKEAPSLIYLRGKNVVLERWKSPGGRPIRDFPLPASVSDQVRQVAFDPDRSRVAIASRDAKVMVLNLRGKTKPLDLQGVKHPLDSLAFSGDGSRLAGVTENGTIQVWDLADGLLLFEQATEQTATSSVAFNRNGQLLAIGSKNKTIKVWDCGIRKEILSLSATEPIQCIAFNASGKYLAFGGEGGLLKIWDLENNRQIAHLSPTKPGQGHRSMVFCLAFSPDPKNKYLVSGSWDGTVKLWGITSKTCLQTFEGHSSMVSSVCVHPNGRRIASAGRDGVVRLWDTTSGRLEITLHDQNADVTDISFCQRDGSLLAAASIGGVIKIWDGTGLPSR